jgi:hypothetical protein
MIGRPFKKGQSGNPGGRPKVVAEVRELARLHAPEAIAALVEIMTEGKSEAARVSAAVALLDRGYGKPAQTIDAPVKSVREMTDAELMAIAAGLDDDNPSQTH